MSSEPDGTTKRYSIAADTGRAIMKLTAMLLMIVAVCPCAQAGLVLEETTKHLAPSQDPPLNMRAFFEDGKLRVQFTDDAAYPLILRDGALYMLSPPDHTYSVLDKAAMAQLAANEAISLKRSEQNMEKMTPAQLAMMQPILRLQAQKLAEERQPLDLRRTNRQETEGSDRCVVWEYYLEGDKRAEACVASPTVLAKGAQMLKAMAFVSDFLATARQSLGDASVFLFQLPSHQLRMQATVARQLSAVVLIWREFGRGNTPMEETVLTAVHEEALDPTIFAVPAGYTRQSLSAAPATQ
jgi:hypothetical protein